MATSFRCCVCQRSRTPVTYGRWLSSRRVYRVLQMTGLLLENALTVADASRLIADQRPFKYCWEHAEDSLRALLKCEKICSSKCDDNKNCFLTNDGRLTCEKESILRQLESKSFPSPVIRKYLMDERKAIADYGEKMSRPRAPIRFVSKSTIENDNFPTTAIPKKRVRYQDMSQFNDDDNEESTCCFIKTEPADESDIRTEEYIIRKNDVNDDDNEASTCCFIKTEPADESEIRTEECNTKTNDRRCGTNSCACCRFYQKQIQELKEQLRHLQANQENPHSNWNEVDTNAT